MARSSAASAFEVEEMKIAYPIMLFDRNTIDACPTRCFVQPFVLGSDQGVSDGNHGNIFDIYLPPSNLLLYDGPYSCCIAVLRFVAYLWSRPLASTLVGAQGGVGGGVLVHDSGVAKHIVFARFITFGRAMMCSVLLLALGISMSGVEHSEHSDGFPPFEHSETLVHSKYDPSLLGFLSAPYCVVDSYLGFQGGLVQSLRC